METTVDTTYFGWVAILVGCDGQRNVALSSIGSVAPAHIPNDGKQTPMKSHPVFIAQHACAACCRGCLEKWYGVPKNRELSVQEQAAIVAVLMAWIKREIIL